MEELRCLVAKACLGDLDTFEQIVRRFQDMAYGYAYSILGDFHLAEDAAQEAFIEVYRRLGQLRNAEAFPGWFRRIVFKHCDRLTRSRRVSTMSVEAAAGMISGETSPDKVLEEREVKDKVLEAIRALPAEERTVTTLFYVNGYSQNEIAGFLEAPITTVKGRLHASRKRLKERMMNMVKETLKEKGLDDRFSRKVIDALLARPQPLEISSHPIREVYEKIRGALPDYETIEAEEIVAESAMMNPWCLQFAYHLDKENILRTETTAALFEALSGRKPPVRLLTAGRVFESRLEPLPIRHELNCLCIDEDAGENAMKAVLQKVLDAVLGPVELKFDKAVFHWFDPCYSVIGTYGDKQMGLAGCGVMTAETLERAGYDPDRISGFVIAIGQLERLARQK